jgi:hypothetical protein
MEGWVPPRIGFSERSLIPVRFVPMTGKAGDETR